jgi:2-oxoglutarate dehydrogenase E1 component
VPTEVNLDDMATIDPNEFLYTGNQVYITEMFERFCDDPGSVDPSWQEFFDSLYDQNNENQERKEGASWSPSDATVFGQTDNTPLADTMEQDASSKHAAKQQQPVTHQQASNLREATLDSLRALMLIRSYRVRGHLLANLDPLKIFVPPDHPELNPKTYGFHDVDMDRVIFINYVLGLETGTMREILSILHKTYCGSIGIEYMHIQDSGEKSWLQERMESIQNQTHFTAQGKCTILERLTEAEGFERILDKKFTGTKRFGLDGGESLVPAMEQIFKRGSQLGVEEIVLGMAHRGRLNILANVMGKPFQAIFSEFQSGTTHPDNVLGSGDVKYHLGTSSDRVFDGRSIHLSLTANPSHLEVANTVCLGKVRGKQLQRGDVDREKVMCLLLHGDAAFSGQGLVPEAFDLSNLVGYQTGGTIHIVINNQIGFTTSPRFSRSSTYCTDVAKVVSAPIFHVNADDPEAVVHCTRIATEYRQKFKRDVVVDMICYRRHGHNEGDEPMFTQPAMYKKIRNHPTSRALYAHKLISEGTITKEQNVKIISDVELKLNKAFEASTNYKPNKADWFDGAWAGFSVANGDARRGDTSVSEERLKEVGLALTRVPDNFDLNPKITRQLNNKRKMIEDKKNIDWATAEALAFGTLMLEGHSVRLSGQDSGRGTFSQRHSVLVDQTNEERYVPLNNLRFGQAPFEVIDSPLGEAGVLGFEYGYSLAEPQMLILWEAQFGDFANGAQVVIDQFICSGEHKWLRMSGLVLLLPHGFEGQGPEHSSARLERYLQLCAEDNMQVCNCTTPSNYFHVLRRQMRRDFRKPLILMAPKSLLRHKACVSTLSDMSKGTNFHRVLWDDGTVNTDDKIKKLVLCSGKVYFDIVAERDKRKLSYIYIMRVEQLFPFPKMALREEISRFKNIEQIVWCQEEPKNMGSWNFIHEPLEETLINISAPITRPDYVGRPASASPATGSMQKHIVQQAKLVDDALARIKATKKKRYK